MNVPLLAQIPIDMPTREGGDAGKPVALMPAAESKVAAAFHELADKVKSAISV